jgi:4-amino-4-deoxy-L-arabinose transferase-like glycosyltransferase
LFWLAALFSITALGLILRSIYLGQFMDLPFFDFPVGDSAIYLSRAQEIAQGKWLPANPFFYGSIFYPYFLAGCIATTSSPILAICVLQVLAGGALVIAIGVIGRLAYGSLAGLAAATLTALYGPLAFLEVDVLGVVWGMLALALGVLCLMRWWRAEGGARAHSSSWLMGAGLCFGLAATERPNLVVLIPLIALWVALYSVQKRLYTAAVVIGSAALPLLMVLTLNVVGARSWVPLTTSFGINLSIGYHRGAEGTFREPWSAKESEFAARETNLERSSVMIASREAGRRLTPQEASSHWARVALDYIVREPWNAARLTARKVLLLLNNTELTNHQNFTFMRAQLPALRWMPVPFVCVLVLGVFGFVWSSVSGHHRPPTLLLVLIGVGVMGSVIPFFVADRYRIPLVLPLLLGSGYALAALWQLIRGKMPVGGRILVPTLIAAGAAMVIALLPLERSLVGRDYWMLAEAWRAKGNLKEAIEAYNAGLEKAGEDGAMLNNLARAYREHGDRERAIATLQRAIAAEPTLALPYKNLGMLLFETGDYRGAFDALQASLRYNPEDAEVWGGLGALLAKGGDHAAAAQAFSRARELAPNNAKLHLLIERSRSQEDN